MRRSIFHWKNGFFSEKGGGIQWMRNLIRISTGSEEIRAIQWTTGLWKLKSCCPHPIPEKQPLEIGDEGGGVFGRLQGRFGVYTVVGLQRGNCRTYITCGLSNAQNTCANGSLQIATRNLKPNLAEISALICVDWLLFTAKALKVEVAGKCGIFVSESGKRKCWTYSQGQKHGIQLKNSQELISPNMSSQFQLENSLELTFISIGRCQLDNFRGTARGLSWRLSDRIFATGSDGVSRMVGRCGCFCLTSGHTIMGWKGRRSPKHIATIAVLLSYLSPLFLHLGWDPCGDRILQSCLQKGPATALANYARGFCFGVSLPLRSLSCRQVVWITQTDPLKNPRKMPSGQTCLQAEKNVLCPKIRDFP